MASLNDMNKDDLKTRADELGITDDEALRTVEKLRAAIREAEETQDTDTANAEPEKDETPVYLVDDKRVDANGEPA